MKILVCDDSKRNLQNAKKQLGDNNELTLVSRYDEAVKNLGHIYSNNESEWDVFLTDLNLPVEGRLSRILTQDKRERYGGEDMPIGWSLAVHAAFVGIPYICMISNENHHQHPSSYVLNEYNDAPFWISKSKVLFTNKWCNQQGKDWNGALEFILAHSDSEIK